MICVLSATNRPHSNTLKVAKNYFLLLQKQYPNTKLFSFEALPPEFITSDLYNHRSEKFQNILNEYIIPAEKFVIISPEYNGSFPGILKVFIDAMHPDINRHKKVSLIGVSTGRAGNLSGMDHLTNIMNHLGMYVLPYKQPISKVLELIDKDGNLTDSTTIKILEKQIELFLKF